MSGLFHRLTPWILLTRRVVTTAAPAAWMVSGMQPEEDLLAAGRAAVSPARATGSLTP